MHDHPPGFTLWFTGLSGAGKSTIADIVILELERRGLLVEPLDGDVVRTHLSKGLGFSKEDRDTNIARIGWVASRFTRLGGVAVVSAISPYEETRQTARELVEEYGPFVLVHVARLGRRVRPPRREGPVREGLLRRDQGVHGRQRPVRGAGRARSCASTRRARSPTRAPQRVLALPAPAQDLLSDEVPA